VDTEGPWPKLAKGIASTSEALIKRT